MVMTVMVMRMRTPESGISKVFGGCHSQKGETVNAVRMTAMAFAWFIAARLAKVGKMINEHGSCYCVIPVVAQMFNAQVRK